jgi:molybdopterin/thiamine biosynthesis adenylyltransferase/rhodanese-related sulfurtransferase
MCPASRLTSQQIKMNRYQRQLNLPGFGPAGQQKLAKASVLVIGAGGLGVPVLQYLCAMGVGKIGIVDGDVLQLTNLQRQVLYSTSDVGKPKVMLAAERLRNLNPEAIVEPVDENIHTGNALQLIGAYDLVVDATDNFSARYLINDACVICGKPWVFGAVHQYEGQLSVFNFEGGPTYRCLFPNQPGPQEIPDCELGGVLGIIPGLIGARQALEAVKILTGIGKPLSGIVLMQDFLRDSEYKMKLKPVAGNLQLRELKQSYESDCGIKNEIGPSEMQDFLRDEKAILWDVREPDEFAAGHLWNAVSVPLSGVEAAARQIAANEILIVYCQKGSRSAVAAERLAESFPGLRVFSLKGGIDTCPPELYAQ